MGAEPQRVAVTQRVDLGLVSGASHKGVVRGDRAVVVQAQHLAGVGVRILRAAAVPAARRGHVQLAVAAPGDPRRAADAGARAEDVAEPGNRRPVEAPARDGQDRLPFTRPGLQVREVHQLVAGELRMQHDVHQPGAPLWPDRRRSTYGLRVQHAVANDAKPPFPLSDQKASVGQKRQAPRIHQAASNRHHADPHDLGGVVLDRLGRDRLGLESCRCDRLVPFEGNGLLSHAGRGRGQCAGGDKTGERWTSHD